MTCSCAGDNTLDRAVGAACDHTLDHSSEHMATCTCSCACGNATDAAAATAHAADHTHAHTRAADQSKVPRMLAAGLLLVGALIISHVVTLPMDMIFLLYLPSYLVAGYDVLFSAVNSIQEGHPFDEDLLMSIATIGALCIGFIPGGEPEFAEAVFVMLFFQVGEIFEAAAQDKSRNAVTALVDIRPDIAHIERDGDVVTITPDEARLGDIMVVRPGERIALDGIIVEGSSNLDTVALTGESVPRAATLGDTVLSGCVNLNAVLRVRVTKVFKESTASRILDLVENASKGKSTSERFITRFARIYTPIVVCAALVVAFVPPLVSGNFVQNFAPWLIRALTFLIVSCPCALVISVPLTFFGGIGAASKKGVLVKGSNYLEALSKVNMLVFDKTGTLTRGVFKVRVVHPSEFNSDKLLHLTAHVERHSTHPIAAALREAYPGEKDSCDISNIREYAGEGIIAEVNEQQAAVGNSVLMEHVGATWHDCILTGTMIHIAVDGVYAGHIVISDEIKPNAAASLKNLRELGITKMLMLSGDKTEIAWQVADQLGIDEVRANLLPDQKVAAIEALIEQKEPDRTLAFVGDGINDAPVLARADIGIAMGGMGSDAAIEAADIVLMDDSLDGIAQAIRLSRFTRLIARQNIVASIAVKLLILLLAAFGLAPIWLAVFGDVGMMVLCVLNASRTLRVS